MENCLNKFAQLRTKWNDMAKHMVYEPYLPSYAICSRVCHIGGYKLHPVSPVPVRSVARWSVGGWTLRLWAGRAVSARRPTSKPY